MCWFELSLGATKNYIFFKCTTLRSFLSIFYTFSYSIWNQVPEVYYYKYWSVYYSILSLLIYNYMVKTDDMPPSITFYSQNQEERWSAIKSSGNKFYYCLIGQKYVKCLILPAEEAKTQVFGSKPLLYNMTRNKVVGKIDISPNL